MTPAPPWSPLREYVAPTTRRRTLTDATHLTGRQLTERLPGVTYRQVDYLMTIYGRYLDVQEPNPGSGNPRRVARRELPYLHVIFDLVTMGLGQETVMALARDDARRVRSLLAKALGLGARQRREGTRQPAQPRSRWPR